jgi:hypothetical protein
MAALQDRIVSLLQDFGVKSWEPRVVQQLVEIQYDETKTLLERTRREAADPTNLTDADLRKALQGLEEEKGVKLHKPPTGSIKGADAMHALLEAVDKAVGATPLAAAPPPAVAALPALAPLPIPNPLAEILGLPKRADWLDAQNRSPKAKPIGAPAATSAALPAEPRREDDLGFNASAGKPSQRPRLRNLFESDAEPAGKRQKL